jgi:hypothetical protein
MATVGLDLFRERFSPFTARFVLSGSGIGDSSCGRF